MQSTQGGYSKYLFACICTGILWIYALLTGMSPSVLRAVVMFSVVAISEVATQENNIYNSLGITAFILLIFNPNLLFSVGFQLSFIAVFGIVYLQPKIYKMVTSRYWIVDKIWVLISVTLAAQLATLPLSLYYFHQFPTYFLISNLIILPAAFPMLVFGIFMLLIDPISPYLSGGAGSLIYGIIWLINESLMVIQGFVNSSVRGIAFDKTNMFLLYAMAIGLCAGIQFRSFKALSFSIGLIFLLFGLKIYKHHKQSQKHQFVFYHISDRMVIDYIHGHQVVTFTDRPITQTDEKSLTFHINPHRLALNLNTIESSEKPVIFEKGSNALNAYMVANKRILIFDSTTFHLTFERPVQADIILIHHESVKNLNWLKKHFAAKHILFGKGNSARFIRKMKKKSQSTGIKIHTLNQDGAIIINI